MKHLRKYHLSPDMPPWIVDGLIYILESIAEQKKEN